MSGTRFMRIPRVAFKLSSPKPSGIPSLRRTFATTPSPFAPRIVSSSLWSAIVPKFIRERNSRGPAEGKSKEWNPATYFIVMFIFVGSQAIRLLTLRNELNDYVRTTDAKIRLLREVIEKLNRGEEVDVKRTLGTGDPQAEAEWKQVIEEIENEGWHPKPGQKQKQKRDATKDSNQEHTTKATDVKQPSEGNFF